MNGLIVSDRLFTFLYSESAPPPGVVYPQSLQRWAADGLRKAEQEAGLRPAQGDPSVAERGGVSRGGGDHRSLRPSGQRASPHPDRDRRLFESRTRLVLAQYAGLLLVVSSRAPTASATSSRPYAPPRQPAIPEGDYARYSDVPRKYFARVDASSSSIGSSPNRSNSVLMLASDHGFTWGEGRPTELSSVANATAARWHRENGMYLLWGQRHSSRRRDTPRTAAFSRCAPRCSRCPACRQVATFSGLPLPGAPSGRSQQPRSTIAVTTPSPRLRRPAASTDSSRVDADAVAKLKALGYIGGGEEATGRAQGTRTAGSLNNEGLLLKQQNKMDEAIDAFDRALTVDPNLASALWNLSDLLFAQNRSLDKSDDLLVRAFAHGLPEGPKYLIGRAIGYQRSGQVDRSLRLLNTALASKPDDPEVLLFRGRYRVEAGDCASGLNDFRRATTLSPSNAAAFASQGLAELCVGDAKAADASFRRSLALDPNQPKVRQYLDIARTPGEPRRGNMWSMASRHHDDAANLGGTDGHRQAVS